jgi:serine/threonine protein kinase
MNFPLWIADERYRIEGVFADSGGMGILYDAVDTRCADNRVLIKTTRYDSGPRIRNFKYTASEAVRFIKETRKILAWEKKVLVRFRNDGLNNLPSPNHYFTARSLTLQERYEGKTGAYSLSDDVLDAEPYLVLEFIPGDVLETRARETDFRHHLEERLLGLARELLTIFIRLHKPFDVGGQQGYFLYQDLKPANILVSSDDYYTLIDFGGVTLRLGGKTTEPTAGCITAGYAAPEAADGNEAYIDHRFDLYTLGATLWSVVTGRDPGERGEFPRLDPDLMRPEGVSDEFVAIVGRALHPDPERRWQSAAKMRRAVMRRLRDIHT